MKKILFILLAALFLTTAVYAQETEVEDVVEYSESGVGPGVRIGVGAAYSMPLMDFAEHVKNGIGYNVTAELSLLKILGINLRVNNYFYTPQYEYLKSAMALQVVAGAVLEFGTEKISFAPELGVGVDLLFMKASNTTDIELPPVYACQFYRVGAGLRYSPVASVTIELVPSYTISPVKDSIVQEASVQLGALFRVK